jgi:hypothetical protein
MRRLGKMLAFLGLALGCALGLGIMFVPGMPGLSWLIAVGLAKLTFVGSIGLIGAGAAFQRLANRSEERERLLSAPPEDGHVG